MTTSPDPASVKLEPQERFTLEKLAGLHPDKPWGAGYGFCMELLRGKGLVRRPYYELTDLGREVLARKEREGRLSADEARTSVREG